MRANLGRSQAKILVAEDEAVVAEEIRDRLTGLHYSVTAVCDSSAAALESVAATPPDLVLIDIGLKGDVDGVETARRIHVIARVPVVFLAEHSLEAPFATVKSADPFGIVLKPLRGRDLEAAIEMALHRCEVERRLGAGVQRYAAMLASVEDGVIGADLNGCVTFMNPVAEALTRWTSKAARGLPVPIVLPCVDERGAPIPQPTDQVLQARRSLRGAKPALIMGRDGAVVSIDYNASVIQDDRDVLVGAVVAFRDIQSRRLTEDALRRAEVALQHAQRMEAVGRLAAGLAHDFGNLLTIITADSELVLDSDALPEELRPLVQEMADAGARGAELTRQLQTFSRHQPADPLVLDVHGFLVDSRDLFQRLLGDRIRLDIEVVGGSAPVVIDPARLQMAVLNLLTNARDAMPDGGHVLIRSARVDVSGPDPSAEGVLPGRYVEISVSDDGVGIDDSVKAHIFEPFVTTKAVERGAGMGLATVFGVMKRFGGYVYVQSQADIGTTFRLYLPLDQASVRFRQEM